MLTIAVAVRGAGHTATPGGGGLSALVQSPLASSILPQGPFVDDRNKLCYEHTSSVLSETAWGQRPCWVQSVMLRCHVGTEGGAGDPSLSTAGVGLPSKHTGLPR